MSTCLSSSGDEDVDLFATRIVKILAKNTLVPFTVSLDSWRKRYWWFTGIYTYSSSC